MPICPEYRWLDPVDWPGLSAVIRFGRAQGRGESCRHPHGRMVCHLGDGRGWDAQGGTWPEGQGRAARVSNIEDVLALAATTRVVLATVHRDHDPTNNRPRNLAALCQRCDLVHDRQEHRPQRWLTLFRRKALEDLLLGWYR